MSTQSDAERKNVLLRAAFDLLKTADRQHYVYEATSILVHYDEADCDGHCLMTDIAEILGIDEDTDPIPTEKKNYS